MDKLSMILLGIVMLIGVFMINPAKEVLILNNETHLCYERYCSEYTLDKFNECIDLGWESVGFLSSDHYYLCDGIKVTNTCIEKSERRVYEGIFLTYRCDCINDAKCVEGEQ